MRWRFAQYISPAERNQRDETIGRIDAWWRAFAEHADTIDGHFTRGDEINIPKFMADTLERVDTRLRWEFGPAIHTKGHRLVVTPEADHELRPMVQTILERAPSLSGWEFYPHRLRDSLSGAEQMVESRAKRSIRGAHFTAQANRDHGIDLTISHPDFDGPDDDTARHAAFVAIESLLGEEMLDAWVGTVDVERLRKPGIFARRGGRPLPLERLAPTCDALVNRVRDQLPPQPLDRRLPPCRESDQAGGGDTTDSIQWSLLELKPQPAADYPRRTDQMTCVCPWPECWDASRRWGFYDRRFSRHGETFAYLKTDGRDGFTNESWDDRDHLQNDLDDALREAHAGCSWASGHGLTYSYIDFALTDVDKGLAAIRKTLQQGSIHKRSWVLFCDADLEGEWIGAYDDSPPPPQHADN